MDANCREEICFTINFSHPGLAQSGPSSPEGIPRVQWGGPPARRRPRPIRELPKKEEKLTWGKPPGAKPGWGYVHYVVSTPLADFSPRFFLSQTSEARLSL